MCEIYSPHRSDSSWYSNTRYFCAYLYKIRLSGPAAGIADELFFYNTGNVFIVLK